jgi:hypothetical protein
MQIREGDAGAFRFGKFSPPQNETWLVQLIEEAQQN